MAIEEEMTIDMVVETHFHADFLSGHLELAAATGAPIGIGAAGTTDFASRPLADGEVIDLGGVQVEVLATPGHTPESISLVVRPAPDEDPVAVLTGDTLFIGDVGRPDLLVSTGRTATEMGALLHRSLQRLLELPDTTLVLPAHGAGSACGKALSTETVSTIGEQRRTNYALQPMSEDELIALVTDGQSEPPAYFGHDARLNRLDHPLLDPQSNDQAARSGRSGPSGGPRRGRDRHPPERCLRRRARGRVAQRRPRRTLRRTGRRPRRPRHAPRARRRRAIRG